MKTSIKISLFAAIIMMTAMSFTVLPGWVNWSSTHGYSTDFPGGPVVTPKGACCEHVQHSAPGMPTFIIDYFSLGGGGTYAALPGGINKAFADKISGYASSLSPVGTYTPPPAAAIAWKGCQYKETTVQNTAGIRTNIRVVILGGECWVLIAQNNGVFTPAADWNKFLNPFQH